MQQQPEACHGDRGAVTTSWICMAAMVHSWADGALYASKSSANRVIVELIESGIEAQQQERKRFIETFGE